ncbi:MAG: PfkB family carbohydrate kinase, partial [Rubrobacteraceae bacterium]
AITVAPGANRRVRPEDVDAASDAIRETEVLVAQLEVPLEVVERAAEVAEAGGTRVVLNLAPSRRVFDALLARLDPLVVNEHEAAFLLDHPVEGVEGALSAAPELLSLDPRSTVITVGGAGAVWANGDDADHIGAPRVEVVDTTGAGDTFVGALAARLAQKVSLPEAVSYAVRAGAAATTKEGAQGSLPTPKTLEEQ